MAIRHLTRGNPTMADVLRQLAEHPAALSDEWDLYGEGGPVAALEGRVAGLLGTEDATFFPTGVMAQQCVLRVWCDRLGSRRVAIPDLSHLLVHEEDGPRLLHGFEFVSLTTGPQAPTAERLGAVPGELGAVLAELPLRDGGFVLPTWEELTALADACQERGVPLHLDGARLWESAAGLGHTPGEIADLADSVYVSFYKGLDGIAGAAIAADKDVCDEVRLWRRRMGGAVYALFPLAIAALVGLEERLPVMRDLHLKAVDLAAALQDKGFRTSPDPVTSTAFRVYCPGDADAITERVARIREQDEIALPRRWRAADVPGWAMTEIHCSAETLGWETTEAADAMARLLP
ncbi:MAG: beta-eliminating lyase-related protein [Micrococcales bacterium]|nr:beta-eliminating lyase-related protein [Micrococcales bacterium]